MPVAAPPWAPASSPLRTAAPSGSSGSRHTSMRPALVKAAQSVAPCRHSAVTGERELTRTRCRAKGHSWRVAVSTKHHKSTALEVASAEAGGGGGGAHDDDSTPSN